MSGSERLDSKAGPLGNLSQTYFGGLDMMVKGYEPALKGVGRWNRALAGTGHELRLPHHGFNRKVGPFSGAVRVSDRAFRVVLGNMPEPSL